MLNLTGVTQQPGVALTEDEVVRLHTIQAIPGKDGLFVITGLDGQTTGGSTAVLVTNEGVVIVDDKLPRHFDHIVEQVKSVTSQPIRYVVNTHHHGDHTGSNAQFDESADTVMHANARANMVRGEQPGLGRITFTDKQSIFLGGVEVQLHYFGRGHTDGDVVVYFPSLGVIHTGDLISDGQRCDGGALTPVMDYNNGASARTWPAVLDGALRLDFDLAIPGHGFLKTKPEVQQYRDRIQTLNERMVAFVKSGTPKEQIPERFNVDGLGWPIDTGNFARTLGNMYDEVAAAP